MVRTRILLFAIVSLISVLGHPAWAARRALERSALLLPHEPTPGFMQYLETPRVLREMSLWFDGSKFRLTIAGRPPFVLDPEEARWLPMRYPEYGWPMEIFRFKDQGIYVELIVRSNGIIEHEAEQFEGKVREAPRINVLLRGLNERNPMAIGGLVPAEQADVMDQLWSAFASVGAIRYTFQDPLNEECERLLNLVHGRK